MLPSHRTRPVIRLLASVLLLAAGSGRAAAAPDFDGDGVDDLLFRDLSQGDPRLALVLSVFGLPGGGERGSLPLGTIAARAAGFDVRTADFDGDGRTDILDRNLPDGRIRIRLMSGTRVRASGMLDGARGAELQTIADFNDDGRADLLLRNPLSGAWSLLFMRGTGVDAGSSGETDFARDPAWSLAGAADFNDDGRTDLLLRRADTLTWRMLLLDGPEVLRALAPAELSNSQAWQLETVGDLDLNGRAELVFRNIYNGGWQSWSLSGDRTISASGPLAIATGSAWRLQGLADLNGDNTPDALLARYDSAAWRVEFLVQGARLAGSGLIAHEFLPGDRIAGTDDYDGDGAGEVLVATKDGWQVLDADQPGAPVTRVLDLPPPRTWSLVCEPPRYSRFGAVPKPADAAPDSAFLSWSLPTTRENGEPLCTHELAGFQIHYQKQGSSKLRTLLINDPRADSRLLENLGPGIWTFRIVAVDSLGNFSRYSAAVSKTIP